MFKDFLFKKLLKNIAHNALFSDTTKKSFLHVHEIYIIVLQ